MAHDVFVSYSSQDKPTADAIVASLEANGIRGWIAPRDILPGSDWSESIVDAIEQAGIMILVFSAHSNTSPQIRREIESSVGKGIPVIPVRIEDVLPNRSLQYFIGPQHWLDAWTPPLEQHLHRLTDTGKTLLSRRLEGFDAARREPRLKPQTDVAVGGPPTAAAEPPPAIARAETPGETAPRPPVRKFAWTVPLILVGSLVTAALGGGVVWWLTYQPAAPIISEKALEPSGKGPALPLRTPQAKGSSPQGVEQPGAPAAPPAEKLTAEDYYKKSKETKDVDQQIELANKATELNPKYAPPNADWQNFQKLNAKVISLKFFEGTLPPVQNRDYSDSFARSQTKHIGWRLTLVYPETYGPVKFNIESICYDPKGNIIASQTTIHTVYLGWSASGPFNGFKVTNNWKPGKYRVVVKIGEKEVSGGTFTLVAD
jgi:hypothetical protein